MNEFWRELTHDPAKSPDSSDEGERFVLTETDLEVLDPVGFDEWNETTIGRHYADRVATLSLFASDIHTDVRDPVAPVADLVRDVEHPSRYVPLLQQVS